MSNYNIGQLRGAWGAGFAAAEKKLLKDEELVGRYFHIVVDGEINNQCHVVAERGEDMYEVQFFGWMMGDPTNRKIMRPGDMGEWVLYHTRDAWLAAGDAYCQRQHAQGAIK